jgi:hypothetical protein
VGKIASYGYVGRICIVNLTHPEHPSSPPVFSGLRVTRSLVLFYSLAKESKKETNWKLNIEDFQKFKQPEEKVKTFSKALR